MSADRYESENAAGMMVILTLVVVLLPGVLVRVTAGDGHALATDALVGLCGLLLTASAVCVAARLLPRTSGEAFVVRFLGSRAAVLAGAVRFVAYVLLLLMAASLVGVSIDYLTPFTVSGRAVAVPLVMLLAIPALAERRLPAWVARAGAAIGWVGIAAIIVSALAREGTSGTGLARLAAQHPLLAGSGEVNIWGGAIIALVPAGLLILLSERISPRKERRLVPFRTLGGAFLIATVLLAVILYISHATTPAGAARRGSAGAGGGQFTLLGVAGELLGHIAAVVGAVGFGLVGVAAMLVVYDRIPRLVRELALDRVLPPALGAPEARTPRRAVVLFAGALAAVLAWVSGSVRVVLEMFAGITFGLFTLYAVAILVGSWRTLLRSEDREERRRSRIGRAVFLVYTLVGVAILVVFAVVEPFWIPVTLGGVAVPTVLTIVERRARSRAVESLRPDDLTAGRSLPTRIHGVIVLDALDSPTLRAVTYARGLRLSSLTALLVDFDPVRTRRVRSDWDRSALPVTLTVLGTPAGSVRQPMVNYVRSLLESHPRDVVAVFVGTVSRPSSGSSGLVHGEARRLFAELSDDDRVMLVTVPYRLEEESDWADDPQTVGEEEK